jgi:hypothetical protein
MLDEIEKFRKENSRYFQQKAQLEARKETNDKYMRDRLQLMESLAQTYDLDLGLLSQNSVDQSFTANMSMVSGANGLTQDSVVTITPGDMENFLNSVKNKQEELQNKLAEQKARIKSTDSELYATIGNLQRKIDAIDSGTSWKVQWLRSTSNLTHCPLYRSQATRPTKDRLQYRSTGNL